MPAEYAKPVPTPESIPVTPEVVEQHVRAHWKGARCIYIRRTISRTEAESLNTVRLDAKPGSDPIDATPEGVCEMIMSVVENRVQEAGEGFKFFIQIAVAPEVAGGEKQRGKTFWHGPANSNGYRESKNTEAPDKDDVDLLKQAHGHIGMLVDRVLSLSDALASQGRSNASAVAAAHTREREAYLSLMESTLERERAVMGGNVALEEVKQKGELMKLLEPAIEVGIAQSMEAFGLGDAKGLMHRMRARGKGEATKKGGSVVQVSGKKRPALRSVAFEPTENKSGTPHEEEEDEDALVRDLAQALADTLTDDQWSFLEAKLSPMQLAALTRAGRAREPGEAKAHVRRFADSIDANLRVELAAKLDDDQRASFMTLWRHSNEGAPASAPDASSASSSSSASQKAD